MLNEISGSQRVSTLSGHNHMNVSIGRATHRTIVPLDYPTFSRSRVRDKIDARCTCIVLGRNKSTKKNILFLQRNKAKLIGTLRNGIRLVATKPSNLLCKQYFRFLRTPSSTLTSDYDLYERQGKFSQTTYREQWKCPTGY